MRATFIVACGLVVLAAAYWAAADQIPASRLAGGVGADGMPKLLAVGLGIFSALLALQTYMGMRAQARLAPKKPPSSPPADGDHGGVNHLRALGLIGFGVLYILLLPHLGYALSCALMLGGVAVYSGLKPSINALAFAVIGGAVYYLIFVKILGIPLPSGIWPSIFANASGH